MKIVVANLKNNRVTKDYVNKLSEIKTKNDVIILPCHEDLEKYSFNNVSVGLQNEIDKNYEYVLLGHRDIRDKENNDLIANKIKKSLELGLKVILCVDSISTLKKDLKNITNYSDIIIAYEENKYIGTNQILTKTKIREFIKEAKKETFSKSKIIYGGGINIDNLSILKEIKELDGIIVGHKSSNISDLITLINNY